MAGPSLALGDDVDAVPLAGGAGELPRIGGTADLIVVVPPRRGEAGEGHLVVAPFDGKALLVLRLPGRELVARITLGDVRAVTGLAADAAGTSLVVCDGRSKRVHVLRWPLNAAALARRTLALPSWRELRDAERRALALKRAAAREGAQA